MIKFSEIDFVGDQVEDCWKILSQRNLFGVDRLSGIDEGVEKKNLLTNISRMKVCKHMSSGADTTQNKLFQSYQ